jgi:MOSC domain-containing protein YiiM
MPARPCSTADGWPPTPPGLRIGATAVVEVTGWRNPCAQIDAFRPGLPRPVVRRAADGSLVRRAGIMGVVAAGGNVAPGDVIAVELPEGPHEPLGRV